MQSDHAEFFAIAPPVSAVHNFALYKQDTGYDPGESE
jgi:hypothetical protein